MLELHNSEWQSNVCCEKIVQKIEDNNMTKVLFDALEAAKKEFPVITQTTQIKRCRTHDGRIYIKVGTATKEHDLLGQAWCVLKALIVSPIFSDSTPANQKQSAKLL